MTDTFWADISTWQAVANDQYPHQVLAFRADFGTGTDGNAAANWRYCQSSLQIKAAIAYVVFKPDEVAGIVTRVKALFGAKCPPKLVFMIDMESGAEFAGGGDHSAQANALAIQLADYTGSQRRVLAYANRYDYQECWPAILPWLKKVTASYGTSDPGTWGWQYYGGVAANPSPNGYPRSCAPFGGNVDMNVSHSNLAQLLTDLGLTTPTPTPEDDMAWTDHVPADWQRKYYPTVDPAKTPLTYGQVFLDTAGRVITDLGVDRADYTVDQKPPA
jgi:hypothetical protein